VLDVVLLLLMLLLLDDLVLLHRLDVRVVVAGVVGEPVLRQPDDVRADAVQEVLRRARVGSACAAPAPAFETHLRRTQAFADGAGRCVAWHLLAQQAGRSACQALFSGVNCDVTRTGRRACGGGGGAEPGRAQDRAPGCG